MACFRCASDAANARALPEKSSGRCAAPALAVTDIVSARLRLPLSFFTISNLYRCPSSFMQYFDLARGLMMNFETMRRHALPSDDHFIAQLGPISPPRQATRQLLLAPVQCPLITEQHGPRALRLSTRSRRGAGDGASASEPQELSQGERSGNAGPERFLHEGGLSDRI